MKDKIRAVINSKLFTFILYSAVAVFFCWENQNFPSLDGPAHFYNSFLLKEYFLGNDAIQSNFTLTSFYIPNIFSNYFIAVLLLVFPFKMVALPFFFSYFVLFLYSAKYLLKSYGVKHAALFSLVFSIFFYSHLITLGFYNFMWAFVFLFYAIGFYQSKLKDDTIVKNKFYAGFFLTSMLLYYTNALAFLFLLLFLFLDFLFNVRKTKFKHWFKIILSLLPALILLVLFYFNKNPKSAEEGSTQDYTTLTKSLYTVACLFNYGSENEMPYNTAIFYEIIALIVSAFYVKIKNREQRFIPADYFFIIGTFVLIMYYRVSDFSSVGMMTARLLHFFYVFLLLWLVLQSNTLLKYIAVLALLFTGLRKYSNTAPGVIKELNFSANEIIKAASVMKPNASVIKFNYSENWLHLHYSSYLGVEKPLVLLDNPEAIMGWFPLTWNDVKIPNYSFNNRLVGFEVHRENVAIKKPDYVFVYGNTEKFKSNADYEAEVKLNYKLVYKTNPMFIEVYALNSENKN